MPKLRVLKRKGEEGLAGLGGRREKKKKRGGTALRRRERGTRRKRGRQDSDPFLPVGEKREK